MGADLVRRGRQNAGLDVEDQNNETGMLGAQQGSDSGHHLTGWAYR